ncbi:conserved membrane hypothetical protein [Nostocoides japonicum T1-X7]|uniref:Tellurite resistance protein permease n=2 Tax=Nostocoides japonicum TaxID=99481 RepID=A0A077LSP9_9MICO|nr:conserved membrane hypothetical protein [Tetrasphaera japonica T1-X7]
MEDERAPASGLAARADEAVRTLTPGYFAAVMATGIVSVATQLKGWASLSAALLVIAIAIYAILILLSIVRVVRHHDAVRSDLADPRRAFGSFTFVAATCVLGSRIGTGPPHATTVVLLAVATMTWVVLGYTLPWTAVLGRDERPLLHTADGTWFIWVVASQSIAVLAATLEVELPAARSPLAVVAVVSWSVGAFLYGAVGVFVSLRLLVHPLRPVDLIPPYWVSMGATAITVVAGSRIVGMADAPMVDATRGLIAGTSVFFWAFGTWLIPPLVIGGYWRHVRHRVPLRYEPGLWSVVFPLGMYGVGARLLGHADRLPLVEAIGDAECWVALTAWALTFVAMLVHLWRTIVRPTPLSEDPVSG